MSEQERYKIAKSYVDKQLETMEKNGLKVMKVSAQEYDAMVQRVADQVTASGRSKSAATS